MEGGRIGTVPAFEDGDNVIFIGDSITHGSISGEYLADLFTYYATRYPDAKFSYLNKGIGGNDAGEALARMNYDIFNDIDDDANKAVILLGTNDMEMTNYYEGTDQISGDIKRREIVFEKYEDNLRKLIAALKAKGIEQIILITPPMYDEWSTGINSTYLAAGFNNVVRRAGAIQYKLSEEYEDVYFIDINTPMYIMDKYNKEVSGTAFNLFGSGSDRVHPGKAANWIIAYAILKAQGLGGDVAGVKIDAAENTADASNASVKDLETTNASVSYTYKPNALPLAADSVYRQAETYFPVTEELNREIIQISGLEDGIYDIKMNGELVMRATAAQLADGVNIADKENNPGQQQALKAISAAQGRISVEAEYRTLQYNTQSYISSYGLDTSSNAALVQSAKDYITNNPTNTSAVETLTKFIEAKEAEADTLSKIKAYEEKVYAACVPGTHTVKIEKSSDTSAVEELNIKYADYMLPQDTLSVQKQSSAPGISVDKLKFTDENGVELSTLPTEGTVNVTAAVTNNTADKISSVLWSGVYENETLSSASITAASEVEAGKSKTLSGTIQVSANANLIKGGLWESLDNLKPYLPSGAYPSDETGIEKVFVNNKELAFSENTTEYVYWLENKETTMPFVSVVPKNLNADIKITQAGNSDTATIKAGDRTYTITFKNEGSSHLTGIKIDGTALDGFVKDGYYYEVPTEQKGTVTASAPEGVGVSIVQPSSENSNTATITTSTCYGKTRTYTIKFIDRDVGELTNIKWKGAETTLVSGVPSRGAKPLDYYDESLSADEMLANLKADSVYENDDYSSSSNTYRTLVGMWDAPYSNSGYYGYNMVFMYADAGGSMFINDNVTRLHKPDADMSSTDVTNGVDTTAIYEFTVSKPATVYITTGSESTYISGLDAGWNHDYDMAKYGVLCPSYVNLTLSDGNMIRVPDGGTRLFETAKGHVYYQHFDANATVKIPAFSATASSRKISVFIVWDSK